jgi:hypothetical protein
MDNLTVKGYAVHAVGGEMVAIHNDDNSAFSVLFIGNTGDHDVINPVVMLRIANGLVIIDMDQTNKPLVDALTQAGVPREKIILAYAGESIETA